MANMQQNFNAGHTQGQSQAATEEWIQFTKDSANAATDRTASAAQSAKDSAQQSKDETASFFQQTGDQMKNMAQGAVDTVKNTLGVGDKK